MILTLPTPTLTLNEIFDPGSVAIQYFFSFHAHSVQPSFAEGTSLCVRDVVEKHEGRIEGVSVSMSNGAFRRS